jgi:hypothetical protein
MAKKDAAVSYLAVRKEVTKDYGETREQSKDGKARPKVRRRMVWPTVATCKNAGQLTRLTPTGTEANLFQGLLKQIHHERDGQDVLVPTHVLMARDDTAWATEPCDGCCGWPKDDPNRMDGPTRDAAYADADAAIGKKAAKKPKRKAAKKPAKRKPAKKAAKKPTKKKAKRGR